MAGKIIWTGLGLMLIAPEFSLGKVFVLAGAIILLIGIILNWLDK
jgi:hypothetical protein